MGTGEEAHSPAYVPGLDPGNMSLDGPPRPSAGSLAGPKFPPSTLEMVSFPASTLFTPLLTHA